MVAAAAAAAVVAKNARLFIVTSLEVLRNLWTLIRNSELPTGFVFKLGGVVRMLGTVASRPGGNVTAITPHVAGLPARLLELARGAVSR